MLSAQAQSNKDSIKTQKQINFEIASQAFKTKTFGILPDDYKTPYNNKSFMGFEDNKLILQGLFAYSVERYVCDVTNYVYKLDEEGNVLVTFDFTNRRCSGNFSIVMNKGENYAEITEIIRFVKFSYKPKPLVNYGFVYPSSECDYMRVAVEM